MGGCVWGNISGWEDSLAVHGPTFNPQWFLRLAKVDVLAQQPEAAAEARAVLDRLATREGKSPFHALAGPDAVLSLLIWVSYSSSFGSLSIFHLRISQVDRVTRRRRGHPAATTPLP
jgi:hypothetical protein